MQLPLCRTLRKFCFFSATEDFIEVVHDMEHWYSVYSVQQRSRRGWPGAWCVVSHWRSPPSSSMFHSPSPRVTKIGSSVSNKKREKDFACLDCTIRQSLRTQHLAFHNLPFFHHFVKVTNIFISLIFHELSEFS